MPRVLRKPSPARGSRRSRRLVAVALAVQLTAALAVATTLDEPASGPATASPLARAVLPGADDPAAAREAAVRALLDARATAVLERDRAGFLAGLDADPALRAQQAAVFDALSAVPLRSWSYELDPTSEQPADAAFDSRYGEGAWWAPVVHLRYALDGFDDEPTTALQVLTFVRRDGRWLLAEDADVDRAGNRADRGLWDSGPVVTVRSRSALVLGHPGSEPLLSRVAEVVDAAVPRVTAAWGQQWSERVVVLVPEDGRELSRLLGSDLDLTQIAAVATAEMAEVGGDLQPVGDRVVVNPETFGRLGPVGRRVVLTHEVTHVATRRATGEAMPTWLVEGFADHVGYLDARVPLAVAARDLRRDVRAGRVPEALPSDADFEGDNPDLAQAYEGSWLAVRLLADRHGQDALVRFYRAVGERRDGADPAVAVDEALRSELGTTTEALTADWRSALQRLLR